MFYGGQLVCFVCYETMALKNFFRENWVWSKEAGMKIAFFFAIFDPTWTHILAPKVPIWKSLSKILILNTLEIQKLYYYLIRDLKTD